MKRNIAPKPLFLLLKIQVFGYEVLLATLDILVKAFHFAVFSMINVGVAVPHGLETYYHRMLLLAEMDVLEASYFTNHHCSPLPIKTWACGCGLMVPGAPPIIKVLFLTFQPRRTSAKP